VMPGACAVVRTRVWRDARDWASPYGWAGWTSQDSGRVSGQASGNDSSRESGRIADLAGFDALADRHGVVCSYLMGSGVAPAGAVPYRSLYVSTLRPLLDRGPSGLPKGAAAALKRWLRESPGIVDGPDLAEDFVRLYAETMRRVEAGPAYVHDPEALIALARSPISWLAGVQQSGRLIAATLLLARGTQGEYFAFASEPDARLHARGLLWLGYQALAGRGVKAINLGGGIREDDGLAHFKRASGGEPRRSWCLRRIHDRPQFDRLAALVPASPYFPPWQAPGVTA